MEELEMTYPVPLELQTGFTPLLDNEEIRKGVMELNLDMMLLILENHLERKPTARDGLLVQKRFISKNSAALYYEADPLGTQIMIFKPREVVIMFKPLRYDDLKEEKHGSN